MSETLMLALALVLVFEGMMPFAAPRAWKRAMAQFATLPDRHIRLFGLAALLAGLLLALAVH
ncbi:DUF2065 domain-containing protein [Chitinibacteraceae bacterium HSL-7]